MDAQRTPKIIKYAKQGKLRKLRRALDRGDRLNSVDSQGRTSLYYAALGGHKACVKELLKRGANPNM